MLQMQLYTLYGRIHVDQIPYFVYSAILQHPLYGHYTSVLTVLYSNKPPCLIIHRAVLASIDVATGYASFSRLADEKLSCGVLLDIMRSVH